jgi:hypothetical protein
LDEDDLRRIDEVFNVYGHSGDPLQSRRPFEIFWACRPACRLRHREPAWLALKHIQVLCECAPDHVQQDHRPPADGADCFGRWQIGLGHCASFDATRGSCIEEDQSCKGPKLPQVAVDLSQ